MCVCVCVCVGVGVGVGGWVPMAYDATMQTCMHVPLPMHTYTVWRQGLGL